MLTEGKEISYTFFAPTAWAFITTIPHNVGDLFIHDAELRRNVLLRHFAINFSDNLLLENVKAVQMADGQEAKLRHIGRKYAAFFKILINRCISLKYVSFFKKDMAYYCLAQKST